MRRLLILCLCALSSACTTLAYYGQAVGGQVQVLAARRPISAVVADPATDPETARKLGLALEYAAWARAELALPRSRSYRSFVQVEDEAPVWSVMATPEFSLEPVSNCFLFVGCLAYRGFFARADAERHAARLSAAGLDVAVFPAPAYSTLGWFADPVFSSMLDGDDVALAEMLFHELAHERLYTGDDTAFDEAFATAVAREGVRRRFGAPSPEAQSERESLRVIEEAFVRLLGAVRDELAALYASGRAEADMRADKQRILGALPARARALGAEHGHAGMFDGFLATPVNNARLVGIGTYEDLVPDFTRVLAQEGHDLPRFYARVEALARLSPKERREALRRAAGGFGAATGAAQYRP